MTPPTPPRKPGRPKGLLLAVSAGKQFAVMQELRNGPGPVNLAGTARRAGISRATLNRWIADEPDVREAIDRRRAEKGTGYFPKKRGTRATRKAAADRFEAAARAPIAVSVRPHAPAQEQMWAKLDAWKPRQEEVQDLCAPDDPPIRRSNDEEVKAAGEKYRAEMAKLMGRPLTSREIARSAPDWEEVKRQKREDRASEQRAYRAQAKLDKPAAK